MSLDYCRLIQWFHIATPNGIRKCNGMIAVAHDKIAKSDKGMSGYGNTIDLPFFNGQGAESGSLNSISQC